MNNLKKLGLLFILSLSLTVFSQEKTIEPNKKFGNPTKEEFAMTVYAPDSSASAVILCKKGYARFRYDDLYGFKLDYEFETRIKVLKEDGISIADVVLTYYNKGDRENDEEIKDISATTYNMENGKVEKIKMNKSLIFKERIGEYTMNVKFSIPAVKVGSIIEYKYKIDSKQLYNLRSWSAQCEYPVVYSEFDVIIPEYFNFNLETRGYETINVKKEPTSESFPIRTGGARIENVDCRAISYVFTANNMPALKADKYIWCPGDYTSKINFEMSGFSFPGQLYKSFSVKWEDIDKILLDHSGFGGKLKMKNPFSEEVAALGIDKLEKVEQKVSALYIFLKSKVKWNESYELFGGNIKKVIQEGSGNNADLNFILMSMMRDANIECYPLVLSRRNAGILPVTHPSYQSLNTFVVGFKGSDGQLDFIDGSVLDGYINVLPPVLMVSEARIISRDYPEDKWVNLKNLSKNVTQLNIMADIDDGGNIKGKCTTYRSGEFSRLYKNSFRSAKDSLTFISDLENKENIKVISMKHAGMDKFSPKLMVDMDFEKEGSVNDSLIYINPMVFIDRESNPFIQENRKLPVEISFAEDIIITANLNLPEGYTIEELPASVSLKLDNQDAQCLYAVNPTEGGVSLLYKFSIKPAIFTPDRYEQLKNFWKMVVDKNNEILVIKKKS